MYTPQGKMWGGDFPAIQFLNCKGNIRKESLWNQQPEPSRDEQGTPLKKKIPGISELWAGAEAAELVYMDHKRSESHVLP